MALEGLAWDFFIMRRLVFRNKALIAVAVAGAGVTPQSAQPCVTLNININIEPGCIIFLQEKSPGPFVAVAPQHQTNGGACVGDTPGDGAG